MSIHSNTPTPKHTSTQTLRIILILAIFMIISGYANAMQVPKYLNYQSILYDDGGNPLPDGQATLYLRILDSNMNVVFEEEQDVEVVGGVVSVIVGNGVDPESGVSSGGVSFEALAPDGPRYLEVQADGYSPESLMELVSVPYSTYADVAMSVADNAIGGTEIKESSITMKHLTDELVLEMTSRITGGESSMIVVKNDFNEYKTSISGSDGAAKVGVTPDFTYSASTSVQAVLKDLDLAIKKREEDAKVVDENSLSLDGTDSMKGELKMGNNNISGLAAPVTDSDAARKKDVDDGIDDSKKYTDEKVIAGVDESKTYADGKVSVGVSEAKAYADGKVSVGVSEAKAYADGKVGVGVSEAKKYADEKYGEVQTNLTNHFNVSNPHSLTPAQIGAVSAAELYDIEGNIKSDKLPEVVTSITTLPFIGSVRIEVQGTWKIADESNLECSLKLPEADASMECAVSKTEMSCDGSETCSVKKREIIPQYEFRADKISGYKLRLGSNYSTWIKAGIDAATNTCFCEEWIGFDLGNISNFNQGAYISWKLYGRQIEF